MRAVLNISLPQDLYTEIDDAISCKEFENKSQLVQTLVSQWATARHQQQVRQQTRRQKIEKTQEFISRLLNLIALGLKNVKNNFTFGIIKTSKIFSYLLNKLIRLLAKAFKLIQKILIYTISNTDNFFRSLGLHLIHGLILIGRDFRQSIKIAGHLIKAAFLKIKDKLTPKVNHNQVIFTRTTSTPSNPQMKLL